MVYRRKRTFRRRPTTKPKRTYRKRRAMPKGGFLKVMRWSSADTTNNCHVSLTGNDAIFSGDAATTFSLSHVAGSGELVSLFDNYRIVKVLYRWVLLRNPDFATGANNKGLYPRIVWRHDFNDQLPINRTQMYQGSNIKEVYFTDSYQKTKWYSLNPASLVQMYESSTTSAYQPRWRQWMDTSDNTAPHYGIKYCWDQLFTGVNVRLEAKIIMECKGIS